jgi:putative transcriptional regulator
MLRLPGCVILAACFLLSSVDGQAGDLRPDGGMFLVAGSAMPDPRFRETVVLIVDHDADSDTGGTFGLVVNRPAGSAVRDVLEGLPETVGDQHRMYIGGPVDPQRTVFLVRDRPPDDTAIAVLEDVYLDARRDELTTALAARGDDEIRVFAGYAGWGPGQLEREIRQGGWKVVRSGADSVFSDDPRALWQRLYRAADQHLVARVVGGGSSPTGAAGR